MANTADKQPMVLVISGSLNPESRSRILATDLVPMIEKNGSICRLINLRDFPLPLCDGEDAYDAPNVGVLKTMIQEADALVVGVPIYNFYANAAVKNLVELTGGSWEGKLVGFICAAGGRSSYMSVMSLANELMLDFRCWIVPRFVYAVGGDFKTDESGNESLSSAEISKRLQELAETTVRMAKGMALSA